MESIIREVRDAQSDLVYNFDEFIANVESAFDEFSDYGTTTKQYNEVIKKIKEFQPILDELNCKVEQKIIEIQEMCSLFSDTNGDGPIEF